MKARAVAGDVRLFKDSKELGAELGGELLLCRWSRERAQLALVLRHRELVVSEAC